MAPLFDLTDLANFADDNFALTWGTNKEIVCNHMTDKLTLITKWLKDSTLQASESKIELCLFYRKDTPKVKIIVNNVSVKSMHNMNVLGVEFDCKLTWSKHMSKQINKANKALHAINMIKILFSI